KEENIAKAKEMLEDLVTSVPTLNSIEVGVNFCTQDRAMDMSIITQFDSIEELEAYALHPEHQAVVSFLKETTEYSKVVDYEAL
ncbi:MAG TPA: Dabb family protein, partial [Epsilonproteobacteria bacterium]|nr:Dabb family protein [Campylobacterota bacterium]